MNNEVLDMLEDLGYQGELREEKIFEKALELGPKSFEYTRLVEWICRELKALNKLEETVNEIASEKDTSNFLLELSSFLKELGCSYSLLLEGHLSERLNNREKRIILLDYLLSELMAARMIRTDKPHLNKGLELKLEESSVAADLKSILIVLKFNKPPSNVTPKILFSKVEDKLKNILKDTVPALVGKPLLNGQLSDRQWHALQDIQSELQNEYHVRREMLIKRLDVTIQSFQWSDRAKKNEDAVISKFTMQRSKMMVSPNVTIADLLAARENLAIVEKTSNASVRKNTQSSINKVIIGQVPDRGGRPSEQAAPPPEMPNWQKDRAPAGGGSGGNFRGRGGGRVQGNWNHGHQRQDRRSDRGYCQDQIEDYRGEYRDRGSRNSGRGRRDYR